MRIETIQAKPEQQFAPTPNTDEQDEQRGQLLRSRIFSDSKFFQLIGIPPDKIISWTNSLAAEKVTDFREEID